MDLLRTFLSLYHGLAVALLVNVALIILYFWSAGGQTVAVRNETAPFAR